MKRSKVPESKAIVRSDKNAGRSRSSSSAAKKSPSVSFSENSEIIDSSQSSSSSSKRSANPAPAQSPAPSVGQNKRKGKRQFHHISSSEDDDDDETSTSSSSSSSSSDSSAYPSSPPAITNSNKRRYMAPGQGIDNSSNIAHSASLAHHFKGGFSINPSSRSTSVATTPNSASSDDQENRVYQNNPSVFNTSIGGRIAHHNDDMGALRRLAELATRTPVSTQQQGAHDEPGDYYIRFGENAGVHAGRKNKKGKLREFRILSLGWRSSDLDGKPFYIPNAQLQQTDNRHFSIPSKHNSKEAAINAFSFTYGRRDKDGNLMPTTDPNYWSFLINRSAYIAVYDILNRNVKIFEATAEIVPPTIFTPFPHTKLSNTLSAPYKMTKINTVQDMMQIEQIRQIMMIDDFRRRQASAAAAH